MLRHVQVIEKASQAEIQWHCNRFKITTLSLYKWKCLYLLLALNPSCRLNSVCGDRSRSTYVKPYSQSQTGRADCSQSPETDAFHPKQTLWHTVHVSSVNPKVTTRVRPLSFINLKCLINWLIVYVRQRNSSSHVVPNYQRQALISTA